MNLLLLVLFGLSSCQDDVPVSLEVKNLVVDVVVDEANSGLVEISASAENVIEYEFYPGATIANDPITNTTGSFNYTYEITGIYQIELRAYGASGKFLKSEIQINVQVGDGGPVFSEDGYITPLVYTGMTMIWQDEFTGNLLNEDDWTFEIGNGSSGWGNNELQYYRKENTTVQNGYLFIEAKEQAFSGFNYTSSRLITKDKLDFKYGRVDIRATLPYGQGLWPALWMLGSNISSVGWPACGEIDIMEMVGGSSTDNHVHGTLHWDNGGYVCTCGGEGYGLSTGKFADEFHVFTIIWDSSSIKWYVDDVLFRTTDITPADMSEFHKNQFFIFNVAVGGNWPGSPNSSTVFPQKMIVDYVRVFQDI